MTDDCRFRYVKLIWCLWISWDGDLMCHLLPCSRGNFTCSFYIVARKWVEGDRSSGLTWISKSDRKILAPLRMAYCEHVTRTRNHFFFWVEQRGLKQGRENMQDDSRLVLPQTQRTEANVFCNCLKGYEKVFGRKELNCPREWNPVILWKRFQGILAKTNFPTRKGLYVINQIWAPEIIGYIWNWKKKAYEKEKKY